MTRETSDCQTYNEQEQDMPEPETEDFFNEVVQNSLEARRREAQLLGDELGGKRKRAKPKARV